jgi:hypothetical protein
MIGDGNDGFASFAKGLARLFLMLAQKDLGEAVSSLRVLLDVDAGFGRMCDVGVISLKTTLACHVEQRMQGNPLLMLVG